VTDRLAGALGCTEIGIARTYSRGGPGFLGRQGEAPVDCQAPSGGHRLLVFVDEVATQAAVRYYTAVWLVMGDDWVVTAADEASATAARALVGGELVGPRDPCCGPPTSDRLPGFDHSG
jgi:hypothetical protein